MTRHWGEPMGLGYPSHVHVVGSMAGSVAEGLASRQQQCGNSTGALTAALAVAAMAVEPESRSRPCCT